MDIRIPNLGEGADSGTVAQIFAKVGATVKKDDPLLELESEKAVATIPSPAAGKITKIHVKQGDTVRVGQVICSLETSEADEKSAASASTQSAPTETAAPSSRAEKTAPPPAGIPVAASPTIRKLAREFGLDLGRISGSGSGGRLTTADVRAHVQELQQGGGQKAAPAEKIDFSKWGKIERKPMTQLRRVIAERMQESAIIIPHVTQFDDVDITSAWALRKKHAAAYEKRGAHLTLTPFVIKAVVETLRKLPMFNTSLDEAANEIVFKQYYHIGIAVDTEHGLVVPVLRDADKKTLLQLARELEELAEKARARKLGVDEMKGGCFTISNQGGIGGAHFTPIINRPEVAILGLGRGAMKPVVVGKKIAQRLMMPIGLSYDHRVVDGANAARFVVEFAMAMQAFREKDVKV
jgi:pyruvate dehydrogenase E2 component (dihydrolipoamide acetyltransferase)